MTSLRDNLDGHGVLYLQRANCFKKKSAGEHGYLVDASDAFVEAIRDHPASVGYHTADECHVSMIPGVFGQYQRPGGK